MMLAEILHKIAAAEFAETDAGSYYPRPSLAGPERCLRQTVYWARGDRRASLAGRAVVVLDDSSWHEELTKDWLRRSAYTVHSEQMGVTIRGALDWLPLGQPEPCRTCGQGVGPRDLHGHIDWIVTDLEGRDTLIEHKALSHFGHAELAKGTLPLDYLHQLALYLRAVQADQPELTAGLLLVKNKNQGAYLEYRCEYDASADALQVVECVDHLGNRIAVEHAPIRTADAIARFREVAEHVAAGADSTLPGRQYDPDHWRCMYCGYADRCWADYVAAQASLATEAELEPEIADTIRYRQELGAQIRDMEKERDVLTARVKDVLDAHGARTGRAGEYVVEWRTGIREYLDRERLDPQQAALATVQKPYQQLVVKKTKQEPRT